MRLITLGIGAALGYFLGSREGRANLEKMSRNAQRFWNDPKTQEKVSQVQGTAAAKWEEAKASDTVQNATATLQAKAEDAKSAVAATAENAKTAVAARAEDLAGKGSSSDATATGAPVDGADADVVSDPATPMADEGPVGQN